MPDPKRWQSFADADPYFYVDTGFDPTGGTEAIERFYEGGSAASRSLLAGIEDLLPGRSVAVEIGCGVGRLLMFVATKFQRVRGVDVAPRMLALLAERASAIGLTNIEAFTPDGSWDSPETADYVYSCLVFQHIEDGGVIRQYLRRAGVTLRRGGVAQVQFDTRPPSWAYRLRGLLPDLVLGRTQRRGIRRIRRQPAWVRAQLRAAGLEIVREREPGSAMHWFVARKP